MTSNKLRLDFLKRLFQREEISIFLFFLVIVAGLWGFFELTDEVVEGETLSYDEKILTLMRTEGTNSIPAGPEWLPEVMQSITALGSTSVLIMIVVSVAGYLMLRGSFRSALLIMLTSGVGVLMVIWLKSMFDRVRPDIVSHMVTVTSQSYPSGHAMMSAVIYLSLASMLTSLQKRRRLKFYSIGVALILTILVGVSRVYLGVHYPSDVLAGWAVGLAWASLCWVIFEYTKNIRNDKKNPSLD